jgi:putative component of toxin-antitoxin plasmid stabilization module/DNA-binding XRE family transcriptional regulator
MPPSQIVFFQERAGDAPVVDWLGELRKTNAKAFIKCRAALARLALLGHELRRPEADYLRDGIQELRIRLGSVNYRLLYFFHGRTVAVVAHGLTKEDSVSAAAINRAIAGKAALPPIPACTPSREKSTMPKKTTTDALKILAHMTGKDPALQRRFEEEAANREVAQSIYQLRQRAGLSQAELARRVGTTQSVISRLEDADYEGHSLALLNRIAAAVEQRVEIRFVPRKRRLQPA